MWWAASTCEPAVRNAPPTPAIGRRDLLDSEPQWLEVTSIHRPQNAEEGALGPGSIASPYGAIPRVLQGRSTVGGVSLRYLLLCRVAIPTVNYSGLKSQDFFSSPCFFLRSGMKQARAE